MNCPIDGTILVLADRTGIEIDHCPVCRGVWLDRGELDKIIERGAAFEANRPRPSGPRDHDDDDDHPTYDDRSSPSKRKRKSFLGDLFELGG